MTALRFLGTGWSHGVPMIACSCPVCLGARPRNLRRRPSLLLEHNDLRIVIDTGPDFREQALTFGLHRLDAVFFTHSHADHVMGFDDVRRLTWCREAPLPVYADPFTRERLLTLYPYVSHQRVPGIAVPRVSFLPWESPISIAGLRLSPIPVPHGPHPCLGIRIDSPDGSAGYVPDCSDLPKEALDRFRGVDLMILNALRDTPHPSHLTLERSLRLLRDIAAPRSFLTHMGCALDYYHLNPLLPPGIEMAWDGLHLPLKHPLSPPGEEPFNHNSPPLGA